MYDLAAPRNPENAQTTAIRLGLQARLPAGTSVETNVQVIDSVTRGLITDIDVLVDARVIVLLKDGNGSGQLRAAEPFLPFDRQGVANPDFAETNPSGFPVVVYATRMGPHSRRGLENVGIATFGGGRNVAERQAEFLRFLDYVVNLGTPSTGTPTF
jgi:hypothetical protein